ncbi:hypothetical protein LNKW23_29060 [Paralimibaculum aggregatum]|uniref:2OG-Fe(II) oxygenase n=1 Tax=Paralimibaculum aggregatum TaxID=3036245 RepID=A0ABQ6LQY0_9RHOB|nr:2OG-Fe(II) oxygenase family protein [Limibaculum sp. NKW23]GMG83693.1 hypothetical protein LNKW23_29060 [Limibaculum sp. NKW23]
MSDAQKPINIVEGRTLQAFATPIAAFLWPESEALNAELAAEALKREAAAGEGVARSNVGGWHSDHDLLAWDIPAVKVLHRRILRMTADLTSATLRGGKGARFAFAIEAWANVARSGQYHLVHDHPGSHWSGVYYASVGTPDASERFNGRLELLDPRVATGMVPLHAGTFDERHMVTPEPGLMVLFPSWLRHHVLPFKGSGERISIAFNVRLQRPAEDAPAAPAEGA